MDTDWSIIDILYKEMVAFGQPDPKVKALFLAVEFLQDVKGKKHVMRDHDLEDIVRVLSQIMQRESRDILQ